MYLVRTSVFLFCIVLGGCSASTPDELPFTDTTTVPGQPTSDDAPISDINSAPGSESGVVTGITPDSATNNLVADDPFTGDDIEVLEDPAVAACTAGVFGDAAPPTILSEDELREFAFDSSPEEQLLLEDCLAAG